MDTLSDFVERNWVGIWKALFVFTALGFLAITILYGFTRSVSWGWFWTLLLSFGFFVSSLITATGTWVICLDKMGTLAWEAFSGLTKTMVGGNGLTALLFIDGAILFLVGLLAMSNNGQNGPFISAVGVIMIIGGILSIPAKMIHNK